MPTIGTAGWSIPRDCAAEFPSQGSALERYAARFSGVEINSSFHRPHRLSTWARWHDRVPDGFRFSVKVPKQITHGQKLVDCSGLIDEFLADAAGLRDKLAVLLVQLPPKLALDVAAAAAFFEALSARTAATIACEPRHPSWFTSEGSEMLVRLGVARVAADPAICAAADRPGGWRGLDYWRLHGSPVIYRSSYADRIKAYAHRLSDGAEGRETWCIFDNTASSAATGDALALREATRQSAGK